jgi:hypothetical protein
VSRWFLNPLSRRQHRPYTPAISGESAILIPCHVNGCHWVAVTHWESQGNVTFLYADDMNSTSVETTIRNTFSASNPVFFLSNAKWINCHNYTFLPHSNESGIHTLLSLSIQANHPIPSEYNLLPLMHQNLSQIGRAWVALSIINSAIPHEPLQWTINQVHHSCLPKVQKSSLSSTILWPKDSPIYTVDGVVFPQSMNGDKPNSDQSRCHSKHIQSPKRLSNGKSPFNTTLDSSSIPGSIPPAPLNIPSALNPNAPSFLPRSSQSKLPPLSTYPRSQKTSPGPP